MCCCRKVDLLGEKTPVTLVARPAAAADQVGPFLFICPFAAM